VTGGVRGGRLFGLAAWLLSAAAGAQVQPAAESPDATEWRALAGLQGELDAGGLDFEAGLTRRSELAQRCRRFLIVYPGSQFAPQAVETLLRTLFERDCLAGGDLGELCERAEHYRKPEFPGAIREEAAYWRLLCNRRGAVAKEPAARDAIAVDDPDLQADFHAYLDEFPAGRHAPRLLTRLFDAAERDGNVPEMRALLVRLEQAAADTNLRNSLSGRVVRAAAIGQPFAWESLGGLAATQPAPPLYAGTLLVVLMPGELRSDWLLDEAVEWVRPRPDVTVWLIPAGPSLGPATAPASGPTSGVVAVAAEARGGRDRPACPEGWRTLPGPAADRFCAAWQVTQTPLVFVVDRAGVLRAAAGGVGWRAAAETWLRPPTGVGEPGAENN
jgi:hypothetical protein